MSKVKDILGLVVRSISKRILGTNVPPMPKADGTLLFHLKRIKDGVKATYDALEERRVIISETPRNIDNLKDVILNANFPPYAIAGDRNLVSFGDMMFSIDNNSTEIIDYETDMNNVLLPFGNANNKAIKNAFPKIQKYSMLKIHALTKGSNTSNGAMLPSSCFTEITLNLTSVFRHDQSAILRNDTTCKKLSMPNFTTGGGVYSQIVNSCSALETLELPLYTGTTQTKTYADAITNCKLLEEINLPNATSLFGYSTGAISNCAGLKRVIAPKCTTIGGNNGGQIFPSCPLLEKVILGKMTNSATANLRPFSNVALDNLYKLEVGEGTTQKLLLGNWTAANVSDEVLNENLKTYLIDRLAARPEGNTETSRYSMEFNQSFYDRMTEENKSAFSAKGWTIIIV